MSAPLGWNAKNGPPPVPSCFGAGHAPLKPGRREAITDAVQSEPEHSVQPATASPLAESTASAMLPPLTIALAGPSVARPLHAAATPPAGQVWDATCVLVLATV